MKPRRFASDVIFSISDSGINPSQNLGARVDVHDLVQQADGLVLWPLERVAADDRAETATLRQAPDLGQNFLSGLGLTAREDQDAPAIEGRLDHVADALGERADGDVV